MPRGRFIPRPLRAAPCICGKHLFERENDGICVWCGHGLPFAVVESAYKRDVERNRAPEHPAMVASMAPRMQVAVLRAVATPDRARAFRLARERIAA